MIIIYDVSWRPPVVCFTKEVHQILDELPLNFDGGLAEPELPSLVK